MKAWLEHKYAPIGIPIVGALAQLIIYLMKYTVSQIPERTRIEHLCANIRSSFM